MDKSWNQYLNKMVLLKNGTGGGQYEGIFAGVKNGKIYLDRCFPIGYYAKNNVYQTVYRISHGEKRRFDVSKATITVIADGLVEFFKMKGYPGY